MPLLRQTGEIVLPLDRGWELCLTPPGAAARPADTVGLKWLPAVVPGTAAQALIAAGRWSSDTPAPLHDQDIWYRCALPGRGRHTLRFGGLATISDVFVDDVSVLRSESMFEAHAVAVDLTGSSHLVVAFRSLDAHLARAKGPRARWRAPMIDEPRLRFVRTTLLGHMPGWCPPVHAVGPWRAVELVRDEGAAVQGGEIRTLVEDRCGVVTVRLPVSPGLAVAAGTLTCGTHAAPLTRDGDALVGCLVVPNPDLWWPHSHGEPRLYALSARIGAHDLDLGEVGFRTVTVDRGADGRGFALLVNDVPIFSRGACWTPIDLVSLGGSAEAYETALRQVREAGVTMLRVGGTMVYEADTFHRLCDRLGILVWQDLMLANFDYPAADPIFVASLSREIGTLLQRLGASPSLAVVCGGSEVFQQAAMMGLPQAARAMPLFDTVLPAIVQALRPDVAWVPSSPSGGALPFVADEGVTHYYGVGAYLRPLGDARRAGVRFAAECLAFAGVPEPATLAAHLPVTAVHHPAWKAAVPRDAGTSWDFEDVRDHYLAELFELDPAQLRRDDPARYLDLSRAVVAEVTERTMDEFRRPGSRCGGALVWLWRDFRAGAGWGLIDAAGRPKSAYHALRRAFAPLRLIVTDEGVNGLAVHLVNDGPEPVAGTLSLAALREGAVPVARGRKAVTVPGRGHLTLSGFEVLGAFFDLTRAYRFGPPAHDVVAVRLDGEDGAVLAEAAYLRPGARTGRHRLGLSAEVECDRDGYSLVVACTRAAVAVSIRDDAFEPLDDGFVLLPDRPRRVRLRGPESAVPGGHVVAINGLDEARYEAASLPATLPEAA